jgi:hypothetical protein
MTPQVYFSKTNNQKDKWYNLKYCLIKCSSSIFNTDKKFIQRTQDKFKKNSNDMKLRLLLFAIIYLTACSHPAKTDAKKILAGMYKLYKIESQDSAGVWKESGRYNGGESYIIYDGLGHMAVQITPKGYNNFNWLNDEQAISETTVNEKIDSMSIPELKAAVSEFASNYVYVGNYTVDDTANIVTHHRITSTIPAVWGTAVKRKFYFNGDTITLKPLTANRRLIWIRQK